MTWLIAVGALTGASVLPGSAAEISAIDLARSISRQGPRVAGTAAHGRAIETLVGALDRAGLSEVEVRRFSGQPELMLVTGLLPGESGREILLSAHFDSVAGSPGAADNAAGCAVIVAAASRLAEIPRQHSVRLLLFDGEERGLLGSTAWIGSLEAERKAGILAAVNIDLIGWDEDRRGTILPLLTESDSGPRTAPAWLTHVLVESSRAVGAPMAVGSSVGSPVAQLLLRLLLLRITSDADVLLGSGIPALTISDSEAFLGDAGNHGPADEASRLQGASLERWVTRVTAAVRRLDALSGRPRDDDQYLAVFGRVWSRRHLYWLSLSLWVVLVFQGLPGRWRATPGAERRRRGRDYLPGFAVRLLLLICIILLPVFTVVLLVPAALVMVLPKQWRLAPRPAVALAVAPMFLTLVGLAVMTARGQVASFAVSPIAAVLIGSCLVAQLTWISRWDRGATSAPVHDS
jgi:hypothetical protein